MVAVYRHDDEPFQQLLKRFRKQVQEEKILTAARRKRFYGKPSAVRQRKARKKRIKSLRTTRRAQARRY